MLLYTGNISAEIDTVTSREEHIKPLLSYTPIHICLLILITAEAFTSSVDNKGELTQRKTLRLHS